MRTLLALVMLAVIAGPGVAQDPDAWPNTLALFFDEEFTETNSDVSAAWPGATLYLVLLNSTEEAISGCEFGIKTDQTWVAGLSGPTIPGDGAVVFDTVENGNYSGIWAWPLGQPLPVGDATILGSFSGVACQNPVLTPISLGHLFPEPPSIPGVPAIYNADVTLEIPCNLPISYDDVVDGWGVVATFFGDGVTATEDRSFSQVKALFQ